MRLWSRVLLALALAGAAHAGTVDVAGGKELSGVLWFQQLSGSVSGRSATGGGTATLAPKNDAEPEVAATLKAFGSFAVDLSYTPLQLKTTFDSSAPFSFGGANFGKVTGGSADYDVQMVEAALRYIVLDNRWFRVSTSSVLKLVRTDITLSTPTEVHRFAHTIPIPMAGLSAQVNFTNAFKAYGSMKFLDVAIGPLSTSVHDWELGVIADWNPGDWHTFRFSGGYRKFSLELDDDRGKPDEEALDVRHQGAFVEVATSF